MNIVVPGAMSVMKWIEQEVARAIKAGADEIHWTTPSGFTVKQRLMKKETKIIKTQLMGRCMIHVSGAEKGPDPVSYTHLTLPTILLV